MDDDGKHELVRIDATGTAHPVGKIASQRLRGRQGAFRLMPSPSHLVVMRYVGEDGKRDAADGPVFRLAGEITSPAALCDIVTLIGQAGWHGELVVLEGSSTRSVFFDQGYVIAASSNALGERLGEVLYMYGALTEEQVERAAAAQKQGVRFGEAAVELGFLAREKLYALLGKQTEEIVYALLRVGDGMFYFLETFDDSRLMARHNFPVNSLLMEGVRRMDETGYFRERIPSEQHIPVRVPGRGPVPDDLQRVYEAADGQRSVIEIGRVVELGEFDVTQALFQLVQGGFLVIHAPRPTGPAAVVALFNQGMRLVFEALEPTGKSAEVAEQLASYATGAGVYDALFSRAGPASDGTFDTDKVVENARRLVGDGDLGMVRQWLYDYVSFAVFLAEPIARGASVAARVAELVTPLAPS